jgi:hypothetical protein
MISVYYGFLSQEIPSIAWPRLSPLLQEIKAHYGHFPRYERMVRCPSFRDQVSRTYVLKSPTEFQIRWDDIGSMCVSLPNIVTNMLAPHIEFFPDDQPIFVAERSVHMEVLPAFMHKDAPKFPFLGGMLDVGKWFRPVHPTFVIEPGESVDIEQGQALMYLRFSEPVKLREFKPTREFEAEIKEAMHLKHFRSFPKMAELYEYYRRTGRRRVIMREIKRGLV